MLNGSNTGDCHRVFPMAVSSLAQCSVSEGTAEQWAALPVGKSTFTRERAGLERQRQHLREHAFLFLVSQSNEGDHRWREKGVVLGDREKQRPTETQVGRKRCRYLK